MDTLVALGAGASFVYSSYALFAMSDARDAGGYGRGYGVDARVLF